MDKEITSHSEALTCALALAIIASTEAEAAKCLKMAEDFVAWMGDEEIERAKAQALIQVGRWEMEDELLGG